MMSEISMAEVVIMGLSLAFSIGAFSFSLITNTKKYELTSKYRAEILKWYSDTILLLKKAEAAYSVNDRSKIMELGIELSAQIDIGRFYFPNAQVGDRKGEHNPSAFQGYRNVILDTLVYFHLILTEENQKEKQGSLKDLIRIYTSKVFDQLNPRKFIDQTRKHTNESFYSEKIIDRNLHEIIQYIQTEMDKMKDAQIN